MKKVGGLLLIATMIGALFFVLKSDNGENPDPQEGQVTEVEHDHGDQRDQDKKKASSFHKADSKKMAKTETKAESTFDYQDEAEKSFIRVQEMVAKVVDKENSEEELITFFKKNGLEPEVSRNSNPYTGSMTMIRTNKAFPGTRYYHAQYFTDEKGNSFLQHMSMEFRPGPDAMNRAQKMIEHTFGVSDGEVSRNGDFIKYRYKDGSRIIWLKKMDERDLENEVYNAYDKEKDLGTIQAAVEIEIHDDGREDVDHLHPHD